MDKIPEVITMEWLIANKACEDQKAVFGKKWPNGTNITEDTLTCALELGLNLDWFAKHVLPDTIYSSYRNKRDKLYSRFESKRIAFHIQSRTENSRIYKEYTVFCSPISNDYYDKLIILNAKYNGKENFAKSQDLYVEYKIKCLPLYDVYEAKRNILYAAYKVKRDTLYTEYNNQCNTLLIKSIRITQNV